MWWKQWFVMLVLLLIGFFVATRPVPTHQGINYRVRVIKIPLYVKVMEFLDRDYHYRRLAEEIAGAEATDTAKAEAIFRWIGERLYAGTPQGLPVVDDHVWHVIVRGYGEDDQLADVMATLAAYVGVPSAVQRLRPSGLDGRISLALVQLDGRWVPVDPYRRFWFADAEGVLMDVETIRRNPLSTERIVGACEIGGVPYARFLETLEVLAAESDGALRASRQMPWRRCWIEFRRWWGGTWGWVSADDGMESEVSLC